MPNVTLRPVEARDIQACGDVLYKAFAQVSATHGFPSDFHSPEDAIHLIEEFVQHPFIYGHLAERDGQILGSIFISEHDAIHRIGPLSIDPDQQGSGLGRRLMSSLLERNRDAVSIRLTQDTFNVVSFSLYTSLGFAAREQLMLMTGRLSGTPHADVTVRSLRPEDLPACDALCAQVHGFARSNELRETLLPDGSSSALVALRAHQIIAYATSLTSWPLNHAVATHDKDMQALLLGACTTTEEPLAFFVPTQQDQFFRWCLQQGLRSIKLTTLMTLGVYQQTQGYYFPSVLA